MFLVWERNPTVISGRNLSDPLQQTWMSSHNNSVNKKCILLSKYYTCSCPPLGITQFIGEHNPHNIKSFHFLQLFLTRSSLPSPQAPCSYLGNLSLFVLSRPFWTTFSLLIQAICSPGRENFCWENSQHPWQLVAFVSSPFSHRLCRHIV